jgi:dienelactone hydrolase
MALATLLGMSSTSCGGAPAATVEQTTSTLTTNGRTVLVEVYRPRDAEAPPAIILLHGAEGMSFTALGYRYIADNLARNGYSVYIPHYFDAAATRPSAMMDGDERGLIIETNFPVWVQSIHDMVKMVSSPAAEEQGSIGLLGFSLGGFLSTSAATQNSRVAAVAEFFGGIPDYYASRARRLPPVLILHGKQDRIVSVDEANFLERTLKHFGTEYEKKIYADQGHGFGGEAMRDSAARTLAFFNKHLKASRKAATSTGSGGQ